MDLNEITPTMLTQLAEGLRILEPVLKMDDGLPAWVYVLTRKEEVVTRALDSIQYNDELEDEEVPAVTEIAIAIPVSSDVLYYLTTSTLRLEREDFAYQVGNKVKMGYFFSGGPVAKIGMSDLIHIALEDSEMYLDDFLEKFGTTPAPAPREMVKRDQEATRVEPKSTNPIDNYLAS